MATQALGATGAVVETMIPRRLDRLPWSRWHWLVVIRAAPESFREPCERAPAAGGEREVHVDQPVFQ
jgi:hypothetical protein